MKKEILHCAWCLPKPKKLPKITSIKSVSYGICPKCIQNYFPKVANSVLQKVA